MMDLVLKYVILASSLYLSLFFLLLLLKILNFNIFTDTMLLIE